MCVVYNLYICLIYIYELSIKIISFIEIFLSFLVETYQYVSNGKIKKKEFEDEENISRYVD